MNTINVENCKTLLIGRRGENEVTTVAFDFTEWASEFGSGVVDLYVKRFGDNSAYPVVLTIDGTVASWLVTETDTNVAGYGKAEYVYRVDGKIAKSAVFPFFVAEDIGQPASEPPDPYESWLEQLTALGAETEAHAQAAEQSAEDAAESAEDAAQSATSAESYAGQAETAAGLAQAAQTASEAARDAAQTAQASAEASATAASGSAASAAGSATAAAGSASDASSSASAAGASATTASTAATQAEAAKTAAQNAQSAAEDSAEDAQQAAQQAHVEYEQLSGEVDDLSDEVAQQKSAIEALDSLVDRKAGMLVDSASGAIASFVPDSTIPNLLGVTVAVEPVQDLHGYDNPWPAGGGVNILPFIGNRETKQGVTVSYDEAEQCYTLNGTMVSVGNFTLSLIPPSQLPISENLSGSKYYTLSVRIVSGSMTVASGTGITFAVALFNSNASSYMRGDTTGTNLDGYLGWKQEGTPSTGNYQLLFQCWREGTVFDNLKFRVQIEIADSHVPTVWHPYENICPISGWDSLEIPVTGVNIWDEEWDIGYVNITNGNFETYPRYVRSKHKFGIKGGNTYLATCARSGTLGNFGACFYDANGVFINFATPRANSVFTAPDGAAQMAFFVPTSWYTGDYASDISISHPSTDHAYHPYSGNRYTIQLGQTVYGGTLDVDAGALMVDRAEYVFTGNETWTKVGSDPTYYSDIASIKNSIKKPTSFTTVCGAIAEFASEAAYSDTYRQGETLDAFAFISSNGRTVITESLYNKRSVLTGKKIVYPLATPLIIQLDPVTISTISGQTNSVWADAGDVDVTYAADIKAYIDSKIAAAVAALS